MTGAPESPGRSLPACWLTCAALTLLWGAAPTRAETPRRLNVFAAASLADAFTALARAFETQHAGCVVQMNFAGSQQLAAQIEQGASADVFASADRRWMDYVQEHGLLAAPPRDFVRNRLVVILPLANPAHLERLHDLARPGLLLILGADSVPIGHYSREVLARLAAAPGFGADFAARVLANLRSNEETVTGVLAKVQLGEADAGIVYRSDVTGPLTAKLRTLDIPDQYNVAANYPIGVLENAPNPVGARALLDLILAPEGQDILRAHGFLPIGSP
jgi:molybdate transport system substrate-binding protein